MAILNFKTSKSHINSNSRIVSNSYEGENAFSFLHSVGCCLNVYQIQALLYKGTILLYLICSGILSPDSSTNFAYGFWRTEVHISEVFLLFFVYVVYCMCTYLCLCMCVHMYTYVRIGWRSMLDVFLNCCFSLHVCACWPYACEVMLTSGCSIIVHFNVWLQAQAVLLGFHLGAENLKPDPHVWATAIYWLSHYLSASFYDF